METGLEAVQRNRSRGALQLLIIGVMTEQQKNVLRQSWRKIIENVRSEDIMDYLIQVRLSFAIHCSKKSTSQMPQIDVNHSNR